MSQESSNELEVRLKNFVEKPKIPDYEKFDQIKEEREGLEKEFGIKSKPYEFDPKTGVYQPLDSQKELENLRAKACELAVNELGLPEEVIDPKTGNVVKTEEVEARLITYRQMIRAIIEDKEEQGHFIPYYEIGSNEKLPRYSFRRAKLFKDIQEGKALSKEEYLRQQKLFFAENDPQLSAKAVPISEGEIFDPEKEFANIFKHKGESKKIAFEKFKLRLYYQQEGWADLRQRVLQDIGFNPDVTKRELLDTLEAYRKRYGFSDQNVQIARFYVDAYITRRALTKKIPEIFESASDFCQKATGISPQGSVEMSIGAISVVLRFANHEDFINVYKSSFPIPEKEEFERKNSLTGKQEEPAGAVLTRTKIAYMDGYVIILDESNPKATPSLAHEEQHVNYFFLRTLEARNRPNFDIFPKNYHDAEKPETFEEAVRSLTRYLTKQRNAALLLAKNEIFAFKKDARFNSSAILYFLTDRDGGLYDYTRKIRDELENYPSSLGKLPFFTVSALTKRILVDEYDSIVKAAINSFNRLTENGYSIEQAIGLLTLDPPWKWKRTVDNLLEARKLKGEGSS